MLICALDTDNTWKIHGLLETLDSAAISWVKISFQAYNALGPYCFKDLGERGFNTFLDLKFHDIPNIVAQDIRTVTVLGPKMISLHTSGGLEMMSAANESAEKTAREEGIPKPMLLGVTVLTSIDEHDFHCNFASRRQVTDQVVYLAKLAKRAGLDGVVTSPLEIEAVRDVCGANFKIATPGVRPIRAFKNDQRRFTTPADAIKRGANYIIIGRPILDSPNPQETVSEILEDIKDL